jgi:type IV secretory pathway ATPase VirB11/archaellum biosynthesis ATPase
MTPSLLPDVMGDLLGSDTAGPCGCEASFDGTVLRVDTDDCEGAGRLESEADCRAAVVGRLVERDAEAVVVRDAGIEARYEDKACALLVAAGRFVEAVHGRDERLAGLARRDPLAAAREASGRADATADVAAETGLAELAHAADGYESVLAPAVGLAASDWRVEMAPPAGARLVDVRDLDTGGRARLYACSAGRDRYVLEPLEHGLERAETRTLARAHERLAAGDVSGGERAPDRAVRAVAYGDCPTERLSRVLEKHTRGYGLLADLFADGRVSDVFVTAPAATNPVRVRIEDRTVPTNVRLTGGGVEALASRFRAESGRAFSRADPTLDATVTVGDRRVRVAGVTDPASEGTAFAFRAHDRDAWTLPGLVANDTLTARAGAVLSLAVERGRSLLIAGPRGAGKTTLLGALLWELPASVRTVLIEDTPELPVEALQAGGRDVQALRTGEDADLDPAAALRTALRLGDGALVVGEVRGAEARVLYEAMRVGANSEAVLGTIHGDGAESTYERVVSDLGVPPSSFGVTDAIVTLEVADSAAQPRRVRSIEEVVGGDDPAFEALFARPDGPLAGTGRLARGNSRLVAGMTAPGESYADLLEALDRRERRLADLAATGRTDPGTVAADGLDRQE